MLFWPTLVFRTLEYNRIRLDQIKEFGNFKLMKPIFLSVFSLPLLICNQVWKIKSTVRPWNARFGGNRKFVWTQLEIAHLQSLWSLRPCSSRFTVFKLEFCRLLTRFELDQKPCSSKLIVQTCFFKNHVQINFFKLQ